MTETQPPLRLPDADRATIPVKKLKDYALDPEHPHGKHKARGFLVALGITQDDWSYLRDEILARVKTGDVKSIEPRHGGQEWTILVNIDGLNGATQPVATRWVVQADQPPRLSTLWVDI